MLRRTLGGVNAPKMFTLFIFGALMTVVSATSSLYAQPFVPDVPQCPVNEILVKCVDSICITDCHHLNSEPYCIAVDDCDNPGCICADGFLRNNKGICVPTDICPHDNMILSSPGCPVNEVFSECTDAVCWKTCDHLITKPPCAAIADCDKPGCVCQQGYVRNNRGVCVPIDNCPAPLVPETPACPVNEMFSKCTDAVCWKTCDHLFTKPPCAAIADCDTPGCVCQEGYLRNYEGVCVPYDTCPAPISVPDVPQCPAYEKPVKCIDAVCVTDCKHLWSEPNCPDIADCDNPGCVCVDGFLRNNLGYCVPEEICLQQRNRFTRRRCPVNEVFSKCTDDVCWKTCDDFITQPACAAISDCDNPGCVCRRGFLRNDKGICVPIDYCPVPAIPETPECPVNEIFSKCTDAVCWKTCDHLFSKPPCAAIADCDKPGCVCQEGFLRNYEGVCVPSDSCPAPISVPDVPQCPAFEKPVNCIDAVCVTDCKHLWFEPNCPAIADCDNPGCVCVDGFLRNNLGYCVPEDICLQQRSRFTRRRRCPVNEVFSKCTDDVCWKTCDDFITQPACAAMSDCDNPGCVCRRGFLRNDKGVCVPTDYCPAPPAVPEVPQCPANEVFSKCTDAVCWKTCDHLISKPTCAAIADCDKPGCVCQEGYLRNIEDICVPAEDCLDKRCQGANEFYSCGPECDNVCSDLAFQNRTNCPTAVNFQCNHKCYCIDGYARDNNHYCVPIENCPNNMANKVPPQVPALNCRKNEVFVPCADAVCWKTCDDLKANSSCNAIADCDKPACVCKEGYYRNRRGICVPKNRCFAKSKNCKKSAQPRFPPQGY